MIDIHCHMLPGIDDGARDMDTALEMARVAVADGITHTICTPHIYPGLYHNTAAGIREATAALRDALRQADIPLEISHGADIQIVPELVSGLQDGTLPTLHGSRYFLFEPPHHIAPPGMLELVHSAVAAGFVPVITHPERLTYVQQHYATFAEAARLGAWIQLTAASLLGVWGPRVKGITEQFLRDGIAHVLASDAHNLSNRSPRLGTVRPLLAGLVGEDETELLLHGRPRAILDDLAPASVPAPRPATPPAPVQRRRRWQQFFRRPH